MRRRERAEAVEEQRVERAEAVEESRVGRAEDLARDLRRFRWEMRILYALTFAVVIATR